MAYNEIRIINRKSAEFVEFERAEALRDLLGLSRIDFASLLGVSDTHYRNYANSGNLAGWRFYSAVNGAKNVVLEEALEKIKQITAI